MVFKKTGKVRNNIFGMIRDNAINFLLSSYNLNTSLIIYNTITMNPIQIAISVLAVKFGIHPSLILLILTFLL
jgi:hypothetical protein